MRGAVLFKAAARETVEETRQALVALAMTEHAKVMLTAPRPARFSRVVDGVEGAPEDAVKLSGQIVYRYHRLDDVVRFALETLFELSPVLSGEYRLGHTIFVDGAAAPNLAQWDGRGEIMIANVLPYARKIEIGKMKMRVPGSDHVYEQAAYVVAKRYGNSAAVYFTYRGIAGGSALKARNGGNKSKLRYPALIIRGR